MDRAELEKLDRESLVLRAQAAGIKRARVLTRPELVDELLRLDPNRPEPSQLKRSRGFFGIARDLLSRVVERGLHLPDAAERFRQALVDPSPQVPRPEAQAIPTVTLAEIYAAQGHKQRAIETLKRVLEAEPDHAAARALLEKLEGAAYVSPKEPLPPEPEYEPPPAEDLEAAAEAEEAAAEAEDLEAAAEEEPPSTEEPEPLPSTEEPKAQDRGPEWGRNSGGEAAPVFGSPARHGVFGGGEAPDVGQEPPTSPEPVLPVVSEPPVVSKLVPSMPPPVDRCIAVGSYVWWQLSPASHRIAEEAFFFLRIVAIVPSWDGPQVDIRDRAVDPAVGETDLNDLPENGVVRVAIGFMQDGDFVPVAHSPALEMETHSGISVWNEWTFDEKPTALDDPLVLAALKRATHV
jgi:hypothetical protein